jgi:hypothetical protein
MALLAPYCRIYATTVECVVLVESEVQRCAETFLEATQVAIGGLRQVLPTRNVKRQG